MANGNVMRRGFIGSTVDDMYFASVTGTQNGGFLECYKDYARRTQFVISPPTDNTPLHAWISQTADGAHWTSKILATCETPEVHELPLVNGATAEKSCVYYKTQENVVTVSIRAKHNSSFTGVSRELICNLPVGFRPSDWVSGACALDIGDSGGSSRGGIHVDATGGVYINGFATYATVYAQISFIATN